jgi:chromosome segregation ATPase
VEVVAQEGGPEPDLEAMLAAIEPEITLEEMKERQAKIADLRNRERQIQAEAEALEEQLTEAEERKVLAEQAYSEARSQLQEVRTSVRSPFSRS